MTKKTTGPRIKRAVDSFGLLSIPKSTFVEDDLKREDINRLTKDDLHSLYNTLVEIRNQQQKGLNNRRDVRTQEYAIEIWNQILGIEMACRIIRDFITAKDLETAFKKYEFQRGEK